MSLDAYTEAFVAFLRSGDTASLAGFCPEGTDLNALEIYRNGFLKGCVEALINNYPSVVATVGEPYFRGLARAFIQHKPPTNGSLVGYGEGFDAFVDEQFEHHRLAYLADLARLDRARLTALFAREIEPISPVLLSEHGQALITMTLALSPAAVVVETRFAVLEIWRSLHRDERLSAPRVVSARAQTVLVWRYRSEVRTRSLDDIAEATFVRTIADGTTLGEAAQAAIDHDAQFDLASTFTGLLVGGVLTA